MNVKSIINPDSTNTVLQRQNALRTKLLADQTINLSARTREKPLNQRQALTDQ